MDICLEAGLNVEGINAEVAPGQWEFQIFAKGAKKAGDEIWVARYLLERTAESYGMAIDYEPKPLGKFSDWNGSGMHANFSNGAMRDLGDETVFTKICEEFGKHIDRHMSVYGANNDQRLTGDDELFGGAGTNVLTGGAGADEFQFTKSSTNDTVKDFSLLDGDTLKFFSTGGALFDRSSVGLNGDVLSSLAMFKSPWTSEFRAINRQ